MLTQAKNEYLEDALTLEAEGFYNEALPAYDEAMKLNKKNATIPFHKGTVLAELKRYVLLLFLNHVVVSSF